jgi:hypothetical protein
MKRALILIGALVLMAGLAVLVARPSAEPPAATPYEGVRGASRSKASGLGISLRRGAEVHALAPGTPVRAGDVLHFTVRADRPRHLLVDLRDGPAASTTIFPPGGVASAPVTPGEELPVAPTIGPAPGKVVVTAIFADQPFALADAGAGDTEVIYLVMEKEPAGAGE